MKEINSKLRGLVFLNISELKPYENNPRINDNAVEAVAASIKEFGFKVPIIVDKNNIIIAGHTRLKAAEKLGLQKVPVIIADDLTEDQIKAFRLADNKVAEAAQWDFAKLEQELAAIDMNMEQFNFDLKELSKEFDKNREVTEDDFDVDKAIEEIEEPTVKRGQVWKLGDHYLMCGDSTSKEDVERLMNGNKADLVVTDPPYNVAYEGSTKDKLTIMNDKMTPEEFKQFLIKAFTQINEVLKEGGAFYIWLASREHVNFETALNEAGLKVRQQLIWNKSSMTLGRQDYQWKHEPCLYGWKEGAAHYFCDSRAECTVIDDLPSFKKMSKQEIINWVKDYIRPQAATSVIDADKPMSNKVHPTMKPVKLIGYLIKNSSMEGETVLDVFGGSGSTMIACEQLKRNCRTMELDPKYCDVIIKRWETLTGNKAILN